MKPAHDTIEIPIRILESVDTLDELEDWLTAHHPHIMRALRKARQDDIAGRFKPWKPRHVACPGMSK